ncbi:MAG: GtrA family protein [Enterovirga sp.]|nr:GtrA family protein [Enterovirga sp.]
MGSTIACEAGAPGVARTGRPDRVGRTGRVGGDVLRRAARSLPRFLAVGLAGLATDAALFALASRLGLPDAAARALSLGLATLVTWRLNRRFSFRPSGRAARTEAARYAAVALCAQGFNYGLFLLLRAGLPQVWPLLALGFSAGCAAAGSFLGQFIVTFGSHRPAVRGAVALRSDA